jgi:hypothetical protein
MLYAGKSKKPLQRLISNSSWGKSSEKGKLGRRKLSIGRAIQKKPSST